jgi:hypothetical protein
VNKTLSVRVRDFVDSMPGLYRAESEATVLRLARDDFDPTYDLEDFRVELEYLGYPCQQRKNTTPGVTTESSPCLRRRTRDRRSNIG